MALLNRKKRRRPVGRQVICTECGTAAFTDDRQGAGISPFECRNCGAHQPPTPAERVARQAEEMEAAKRVTAAREVAAQRKRDGLPVIWIEVADNSSDLDRAARKDGQVRERVINELLSKDSHSPVGRKSDPTYDRADYLSTRAQLRGEKIGPKALSRKLHAGDKSGEEHKIDKMRQALKRRKRK